MTTMIPNNMSLLRRLIESDSFPFEFLSALGQQESWRKEIYRPIYHVHKWWAKRLGSVFRGILLGCGLPETANLEEAFYQTHQFSGLTVFDPFMGSGTTIGEAHKLGYTALGRDINPIACESVRVTLGPLDRRQLQEAFSYLSTTVGPRLQALYQAKDEKGQMGDVLYYFWVKQVSCPNCTTAIDLFSTRIIAQHAYPDRKPEVQVCCPQCGNIFPSLHHHPQIACPACDWRFKLHQSNVVNRTKFACPGCTQIFSIVEVIRAAGTPPSHRLYGKLLLTAEGNKCYLPATPEDWQAYQVCANQLQEELQRGAIHLPSTVLTEGFNTRQAMNYNYRQWRDFFNDRQLLALGWLQEAIANLPETSSREVLLTLFSGILEFNNVFASYKGEGTGAVRHLFSHHILKPERTPIEANVWGTPKSSGSFLTLFKTRILRAIDYRQSPVEIRLNTPNHRHLPASPPFSGQVAQEEEWPTGGDFKPRGIYLSCGSSDVIELPNRGIDLVVTDPPFFDNVHYSELADFFYAWQSLYPRGFIQKGFTTRHPKEVQDTDATQFATKLRAVWQECGRVLKDEGLLVFTYHHSRLEGWTALIEAIWGAGFAVVNAHPVKAEMSGAIPKSQAKSPIQLDIILVCKKIAQDLRSPLTADLALAKATEQAILKLTRLTASLELTLSQNDCKIVLTSLFISALGPVASAEIAINYLLKWNTKLEKVVEDLLLGERPNASIPATTLLQPQLAFSFTTIPPFVSR